MAAGDRYLASRKLNNTATQQTNSRTGTQPGSRYLAHREAMEKEKQNFKNIQNRLAAAQQNAKRVAESDLQSTAALTPLKPEELINKTPVELADNIRNPAAARPKMMAEPKKESLYSDLTLGYNNDNQNPAVLSSYLKAGGRLNNLNSSVIKKPAKENLYSYGALNSKAIYEKAKGNERAAEDFQRGAELIKPKKSVFDKGQTAVEQSTFDYQLTKAIEARMRGDREAARIYFENADYLRRENTDNYEQLLQLAKEFEFNGSTRQAEIIRQQAERIRKNKIGIKDYTAEKQQKETLNKYAKTDEFTKTGLAVATGTLEGLSPLPTEWLPDNLSYGTTVKILSKKSATEKPTAYTAGTLIGSIPMTMLIQGGGSFLISEIPVINKAFSTIKNPAVRAIVADMVPDIIMNTLTITPQIIAGGIKEGKSTGDIVKDVFVDQALNAGIALAVSGVTNSKVIKQAIADYNTGKTTQEALQRTVQEETEQIVKDIPQFKVVGDNKNIKLLQSDIKAKNFESEVKSFHNQLDSWQKGKMQPSDKFRVMNTPEKLVQLGVNDAPITMSQGVLKKLFSKHELDMNIIKRLPAEIQNPLMVFKSATHDNSIVILTEMKDRKNKSIIAAIHLDIYENRNLVNKVARVYGRNNEIQFVERQIKENRLLYFDKGRSLNWFQTRGLQLPKVEINKASFNNSIPKNTDIVNVKNSEIKKGVTADLSLFNEKVLSDYNTARKNLIEYAKQNFPNKVINNNTQMEIGISRKGIDKLLSGNITFEKYASAFHTPELIENAKFVDAAPYLKSKGNIYAYTYFDSPISIGDKDFVAHIRVRGTNMGQKYYGHTLSGVVDDIKIEPLARTLTNDLARQPVQSLGSNDIIRKNTETVNVQNAEIKKAADNYNLIDRLEYKRADDYAALSDRELEQLTQAKKEIREFKAQQRKAVEDKIDPLLENSNKWKDKSALSLQRETWERNIIDIAGETDGRRIIDEVFRPIHVNEAERVKFLRNSRAKIKALKLSRKESELVQQIGEGVIDITNIPKGFNVDKIDNAVKTFRQFYDDILPDINDALVRNGYAPIKGLQNYFPHFNGDDPVLKALGINLDVADLPTDINGLTHKFRPGKNWVANFMHRTGDKTTYDAVQGFDKYIESVSKVIYHTDDIQRLRTFNKGLRTKYSSQQIQDQIKELLDGRNNLTQEQIDTLIEDLLKREKTHLSNAVADLDEFTNVLAGKKDLADRASERWFGRKIYNASNTIINRAGKNMVAVNPGTWLTQFIPLTQSLATTDKKSFVQGMYDTVQNLVKNDGFEDASAFLAARQGSDILSKGITDKVGDAFSSPMKWIDEFTSNIVVRSKYIEGINKGLDIDAALKQADEWAAKMMGDRSLGSMPTLFNQRNPLTKLVTQFQLEVNNQVSFVLKDIPKEALKNGVNAKNIAHLSSMLGQLALYGFLFNQLYEAIVGRRPALDPIGTALNIGEDLSNENLSATDKAINTTDNIVEQLPFVGSWVGGGRLPALSGLPDIDGITSGTADLGKEAKKTILYSVFPFGGGQIKKTTEGLGAFSKGGSYTDNGNLRFPIEQTPGNAIKSAVFGQWSTPAAREYFKNTEKPLSDKQTRAFEFAMENGIDPDKFYNAVIGMRRLKPFTGKNSVTKEQKTFYLRGQFKEDKQFETMKKILLDPNWGKAWDEIDD